MSPARAVRLYTAAVFFTFMGFSALFMAAGGLGLAASAGMIGLLWAPLLLWPVLALLRRPPPALVFTALFLAWTALSLAWSPYEKPDQAIKLLVLTPFFALVPFGAARLDAKRKARFAAYTAILVGLAGAFFVFEAVTGSSIGYQVKLAQDAEPGAAADILANRTNSRGVSALILITGPLAIWLWTGGRKVAAGALALTALVGSVSFGVEANFVALIVGAAAGALAWRRSGQGLAAALYAAAALILLTPFLLGMVSALLGEDAAQSLPFSWHQRLLIYGEGLRLLSESPIVGLGLDASRTLKDEVVLRGYAMQLIPLHPHNAGLHIWLETGAVGAGLAAAALLLLGRSAARSALSREVAAGLAFAFTAWFMMTTLGFGVWQEWHHGALGLALAVSMLNAPRER
ncbi:MAG: hypothetical protein RKE49_02215 [Oceanicaulis sp.]